MQHLSVPHRVPDGPPKGDRFSGEKQGGRVRTVRETLPLDMPQSVEEAKLPFVPRPPKNGRNTGFTIKFSHLSSTTLPPESNPACTLCCTQRPLPILRQTTYDRLGFSGRPVLNRSDGFAEA